MRSSSLFADLDLGSNHTFGFGLGLGLGSVGPEWIAGWMDGFDGNTGFVDFDGIGLDKSTFVGFLSG